MSKETINTPMTPIHSGAVKLPKTSAQHLQRTTEYAQDPLGYLERTIGAEAISLRRALLSLPETLPLENDFYGSGAHKDRFEAHIAKLFGKRHALFFATGVQAQSVACGVHA